MDHAPLPTTSAATLVISSTWDMCVTRTYEANRTGLMAAAARVCGQDQAADITQDAFLRVWANPDAFDEARGTLTRYLYLVTRGVSIDRVRATASQRARDTKDQARNVPTTDDPVSRLISLEREVKVRRALATLRQVERDVIEAAYFGHLTYRQVSVKLNLPEGTVKSRMRLALVRLRVHLGRVGEMAA